MSCEFNLDSDSKNSIALENDEVLIIPDGITEIKSAEFCGCENFGSVIIPASVTDINKDVFDSFDNLKEIIVAEDNPVYASAGGGSLFKRYENPRCISKR